LGRKVSFFLNGGEIGETIKVTLTMKDSFENIKHDTIESSAHYKMSAL
jgi:hypothetical protein